MALLIVGLVLLLGAHSIVIVAPSLRDRIVADWGERRWKVFYSVLSLIGLWLVIRGFAAARPTALPLYAPPLWLKRVAVLVMLPVFPLLFATYLPGRIRARVQHPLLAAIKFWALAHLLANGSLADVLLFGAILAWAAADRVSLKHRGVARPVPGFPPRRYNDLISVLAGLVVYAILIGGGHRWLFGVSPLG